MFINIWQPSISELVCRFLTMGYLYSEVGGSMYVWKSRAYPAVFTPTLLKALYIFRTVHMVIGSRRFNLLGHKFIPVFYSSFCWSTCLHNLTSIETVYSSAFHFLCCSFFEIIARLINSFTLRPETSLVGLIP